VKRVEEEMVVTDETANITCDSSQAGEAPRQRTRLLPLLAAWLRPATWAPIADRVPLRRAFLVHVLAGIGFSIGLLSIDPFSEWLRHDDYSLLHLLVESILRFATKFESHPTAYLLINAGIVALTEASCVVVALLIMPWGATDEPLQASFARALRRVWLHTTQAVPLFVLGGVPITYMEHLRYMFHRSVWTQGTHRAYETYPWWVRNDEVIIGYIAVAVSLWFVWALFRAAGVTRKGSPVSRAPMCEYCGYNLTGTSMEGRCPECGVPASLSLGPDVRTGTVYDRAEHGGISAMLECWLDAIFRPKTIGRQIQVTQTTREHRRCLTAALVPAFVMCTAGLLLVVRVLNRRSLDADVMIEVVSLMPFANVCGPAGLFLLAMLIAAAVGTVFSIRDKRNLLAAAVQMQCYLGGFLLLWLVFGWAWGALSAMLDNEGVFRGLGRALRTGHESVAFMFWLLPLVAGVFLDAVLVWKGTSAARYANR
jgi:hypothetical protein